MERIGLLNRELYLVSVERAEDLPEFFYELPSVYFTALVVWDLTTMISIAGKVGILAGGVCVKRNGKRSPYLLPGCKPYLLSIR